MTRAQEVEQKAREEADRFYAPECSANKAAFVDGARFAILALPAEGGEPKLETTWMTRASMKAAAEMKLPEETAAEEISNEMTLALLCDIDTLLARTNRDGVKVASQCEQEATREGLSPRTVEVLTHAAHALRTAPAQDEREPDYHERHQLLEMAREDERGKIVAWMRSEKIDGIWIAEELADAIERGDFE